VSLRKQSIWRHCASELVCVLLFAFVSQTVVSTTERMHAGAITAERVLAVAAVDGAACYAFIYLNMELSRFGRGGYFNPALTTALALLDAHLDGLVLVGA
jgi:glycerol uptake facilitator-like aquaporin